MNVEIVNYPAASDALIYLATADQTRVFLAIYSKMGAIVGEAIPAAQALPIMRSGHYPEFVLHDEGCFQRISTLTHDPAADIGQDEVVDFSVLDAFADGQMWEPRLPQTKQTKQLYSMRHRQAARRRLLASLYVRFATGDLSETVLHLVDCDGCLVTDLKADKKMNGPSVPVGKAGGATWLSHMWNVEVRQDGVRQDGAQKFVAQLREQSGPPINRKTRLYLESDAGYLPRRTVETDNRGRVEFVLLPMGLEAGERFKIKLNATHFTSVGQVEGVVA